MITNPLVSLCIPTNGITEWVIPVLDSIYSQGVNSSSFEVIIADNGDNVDFERTIRVYQESHENLLYFKTTAKPFINEIETYKRASGLLIKFVNHRTRLVKGALERLLNYAIKYQDSKPIIYFSNGVLKIPKTQHFYETFDEFVFHLSYWSSWSTGMTIWREDFSDCPKDVCKYNELFPHTTILFSERNRKQYCIDNTQIFEEMKQGKKAKGTYDLFYAFGVEYPWILCSLYKDKSITFKTFNGVLRNNLKYVANLYYLFCIKKQYCSYDLSGINNMFDVFYSKKEFFLQVFLIRLKHFLSRGK